MLGSQWAPLTSEPCGCGTWERVLSVPVHRVLRSLCWAPHFLPGSPGLAVFQGPVPIWAQVGNQGLSVFSRGLFVREDFSIQGFNYHPKRPWVIEVAVTPVLLTLTLSWEFLGSWGGFSGSQGSHRSQGISGSWGMSLRVLGILGVSGA